MGKGKTPKERINTEGGAYIGGNVSMGDNSRFVGRDDYSRTDFRNKRNRRINAKRKNNLSMIKALIVGGIFVAIFELLAYRLPWTWLITHPNSYGLQLAIDVLLWLLIFTFFVKEWRKYIFGSMLIPIFGFLLALLKESK